MAEFVQAGMEGMLMELQQLQRVQLLSPEEVKIVISKRKNFEYKLQKRQKQKEDILGYIQYESGLLHLIGMRRDQSKYTGKKDDIDYAIARRINKLFRILEHRFAGDLMIWSSHIAFLKQIGWKEYTGKVYRRMLQVHPDKVDLWLSAARSEMDQGTSDGVENARTLYMEALRFHPKSRPLYLDAFCLELTFVGMLKREPSRQMVAEETKDLVLEGRIAEVMFKKGAEESCEVPEEKIELAVLCLQHSLRIGAPRRLIQALIDYLVEEFPSDPLTWEAKAVLSLHADHLRPRSQREKIEDCCQAFEDGLKRKLAPDVPALKKDLLRCYVGALNRLQDNVCLDKTCSRLVCERLWRALRYGDRHQLLGGTDKENVLLLKRLM